jgi:hypothetical protein
MQVCFATITTAFNSDLQYSDITDSIPFTIEERLFVNVWVHDKGRSVQTRDDGRRDVSLPFNKSAPTEASLHKWQETRQEMYL